LDSQGGAHSLELFRQLPRPGLPLCRHRGCNNQLALHRRRRNTRLELGSQSADFAAQFLFGVLAIEVDETAEEIVVADIGQPAIGGEDRTIEVVV
jgi:hypothetical protein